MLVPRPQQEDGLEEGDEDDQLLLEGGCAADADVDSEAVDEVTLEAAMNAALTTEELTRLQQVRVKTRCVISRS